MYKEQGRKRRREYIWNQSTFWTHSKYWMAGWANSSFSFCKPTDYSFKRPPYTKMGFYSYKFWFCSCVTLAKSIWKLRRRCREVRRKLSIQIWRYITTKFRNRETDKSCMTMYWSDFPVSQKIPSVIEDISSASNGKWMDLRVKNKKWLLLELGKGAQSYIDLKHFRIV